MRVAVAALIYFMLILLNSHCVIAEPGNGGISFERNDRVLTWQTVNSGRYRLSEKFDLNLNSNLSSSLNLATGYGLKDRWYDSVYNTAELEYDFSDKMNVGFTARENWNRDTLSKFGKSVLTTNFDSVVKYNPVNNLDLSLGLGHMYDRRFENEDNGMNVNGAIQYRAKSSKNTYTSLNVTTATSNLNRSNDILFIQSNVQYSHNLANIVIGYDRNYNSRGYFSDVDRKLVEERTRTENSYYFILSRGSFNNFRNATAFELRTNLGNHNVDDTANDNKLSSKFKNDSKGTIKDFGFRIAHGVGSRILAKWQAGYTRDANNVERLIRSRTQTNTSMGGEIGIGIGSSDSLSIIGTIIRARIDTPAGVANDRDELKIESGVNYIKEFNTHLKTGLDFRVLETHYVNIDATQSIQNKWIKSYQFSPSLSYTPTRSVKLIHKVVLYANHMDYDFDSETNPRSNITRRVSSESRINASLSARTVVKAGFMFEENDYGNLDLEDRKLPVEEGIRRFGDIRIEYMFADWITVSPQYIYAIRKDTDIDSSDIIRREVDQTFGIDFDLLKNENGDYSTVLSFKRVIRKTNIYPIRIRDYININMRYTF
ncbi:hypothetical protein ACFL6H_08980 [Candidatus Latescibacterota bacterium]